MLLPEEPIETRGFFHRLLQELVGLSTLIYFCVFQSGRRHNVRSPLVPDVVRAQPEPVLGRGAAVRLLPVRGAAVPGVRDGGAGEAPRARGLRLRVRHGHAALPAVPGESSSSRTAPLFPVYVMLEVYPTPARETYLDQLSLILFIYNFQLPDDLPFEDILVTAQKLYDENDPTTLEKDVAALERRE